MTFGRLEASQPVVWSAQQIPWAEKELESSSAYQIATSIRTTSPKLPHRLSRSPTTLAKKWPPQHGVPTSLARWNTYVIVHQKVSPITQHDSQANSSRQSSALSQLPFTALCCLYYRSRRQRIYSSSYWDAMVIWVSYVAQYERQQLIC